MEALHLSTSEFQAYRWFQAMLVARGLTAPDGERSLYKYDLTPQEATTLQSLLYTAFMNDMPTTPRMLGACFCLWVSHWFQKEFSGGSWSWQGPAKVVGAPVDFATRTNLVVQGMDYLQRKILVRNGDREYLVTLISEAGFPCRLISEHNNWLKRYTEAVTLATSQGEVSLAAGEEHASFYQYLVPSSFRAASLFEVTGNLAYHVAQLRKILSEHGVSEGAIEWLNRVVPEWREKLPITADDEAARILVEGLVRASPAKVAMPVACQRLLRRNANGDCGFGLRLGIEGKIDDGDLPDDVKKRLKGFNRARILPSGSLERAGLPAIAVAYRVAEQGAVGWEVESLLGREPTTVNEFPTGEDVCLIFSIGDRTGVEFVPRGGGRVTSDVLIFRRDGADADDGIPSSFVMIGTGSVKDREERLFLAVRKGAVMKPGDGSVVTQFGEVAGFNVFALSGLATIVIERDRYVVRSSADQTEHFMLEAVGPRLEGVASERPAYLGCPGFFIHNGILRSAGDKRKLRMRVSGRSGDWLPFEASKLPFGEVDIAAIDSNGVILDRLTFIHLPSTTCMGIAIPKERLCQISVSGIEGARIEAVDTAGIHVQTIDNSIGRSTFIVPTSGIKSPLLSLRIRWAASETILSVSVLSAKLAFYKEDGALIEPNSRFSLAGLRGASVDAAEKASVLITLRGRDCGSHPPVVERGFERSLPFSQIRDDIGLLFSMTDDLDAEVMVEALQGGAAKCRIYVRRFDVELVPDGDGQVALSHESMKVLLREQSREIDLYGRPFFEITGADRKLERIVDSKGFYWTVDDGEGPWFVYAKIDGIPRSRPLHVNRSLWAEEVCDAFYGAVTTVNKVDRRTRILALLQAVGNGEDTESRTRLVDLIGSLDAGLPLQAFDILSLMPEKSDAAVYMAAFSTDDALRVIIELDERLPLDWHSTNPAKWREALVALRAGYRQTLSEARLPEDLVRQFADEHVRGRVQEIARRRPMLSVHLAIAFAAMKLKPDKSAVEELQQATQLLVGAAQDWVPRVKMQLPIIASSARRTNDGRRWPTVINFRAAVADFPFGAFEAPGWAVGVLDAPFAAAAIALGNGVWTPEIERSLRICRSFDPSYFESAYLCAMSLGWAQRSTIMAGAA